MVDKRPIGVISGKADYLEKKVPKNPKYSHVTSSLKTGTHVNHVEVISDSNIAKRKGELFRRIKPTTLAGLLKEERNGESIYNLVDQTNPGESVFGDQNDTHSVYSAFTSKTGYTEASKLSSITSATQQLALGDNSEFLLLDLREPEDYELYHIKEAISYPAPNLGRDKVIPELFKFKNKEGKLIIIYHTDERNGVTYGNLMAQKNYENIYLLTGGIESFLEDLTQYLEGKKVPAPLKQEKKKQVVYKRSNYEADPDRNTINIPSQHIEDDNKSVISNNKSVISNATKASGMTGISKTTTKTHQSKYTSGTFGRTERKL